LIWSLSSFVHIYYRISIKDYWEIRFCENKWLDNGTLRELYPPLYNLLNSVNYRFKFLIRVRAHVAIWSFCLCRNDKVFNNKKFFSACRLSIDAQLYSVHMVVSTTYGKLRHGCVYTVAGHGDGYFYPT
jgi:hypothetical protein